MRSNRIHSCKLGIRFFKCLGFILLFGLLVSGCTEVNSQFPLSQPGEQPNDERLSGVWTVQEKDDPPFFIHISREKEGWLEGVMVGSDDGGLGLSTFQALTTQIGESHFLSIRNLRDFNEGATGPPEKPAPEGGLYWIFIYEISGEGALHLRFIDYDYVKAGIEAGRVEGSKAKDESIITLTDNSENLSQFIKDSDLEKLFPASQRIPGENSFLKLIVPPPPKSE